MFFKLLPTLTKTKLEQAKIVFKSDHQKMGTTIVPNQFTKDIKEEPAYDVESPFINTEDTYNNIQETSHDTQVLPHDVESYDLQHDQCVEIRVRDDTEENEENIAEEVIQYLQQLQEQGVDDKNVKVIYVQNGQIVGVTDENSKQGSDSNIEETIELESSYIGKNNEQEIDSHKDINCTQYENVTVEKFKKRKANISKELISDLKSIVNVDSEESDSNSNK